VSIQDKDTFQFISYIPASYFVVISSTNKILPIWMKNKKVYCI